MRMTSPGPLTFQKRPSMEHDAALVLAQDADRRTASRTQQDQRRRQPAKVRDHASFSFGRSAVRLDVEREAVDRG